MTEESRFESMTERRAADLERENSRIEKRAAAERAAQREQLRFEQRKREQQKREDRFRLQLSSAKERFVAKVIERAVYRDLEIEDRFVVNIVEYSKRAALNSAVNFCTKHLTEQLCVIEIYDRDLLVDETTAAATALISTNHLDLRFF